MLQYLRGRKPRAGRRLRLLFYIAQVGPRLPGRLELCDNVGA